MERKIYVIVGPTASGKSGLALNLAKKIKGSIVNADSMQIYKDLKILSARPDEAEMDGIPHFLYGYLDAYQANSVSDWLKRAVEKLKEVERPILVGGTGMYVSALINGLSPIPNVDPVIRETVRNMSIDDVKKQVKECSAIDPQRLRRALEIQLSTGKTLSYFQNLPKIKLLDANFDIFFVNPERDILYHNCNQRLVQMVNNGAIEEVRHLLNINATGGVVKAIGVPEIVEYLSGKNSFEKMVQQIQLSTRHYAKRQVTWFKNQLTGMCEIKNPVDFVFTV
ncbi:MAG: tRNA (adenosine(37)-N6)-dimethylallyltransferase MiaA [Alphaproteobacteria bacterium]|nr:tRNA (adenosine(37)-N6)-dimethylallyltransferase MiaA [Alphaproteobacteria bacterium]